jgi:glycosyltransferase involved in cell wall biosynthesis
MTSRNRMESSRPLVSICIPTYNGNATLAETLDSIVTQAFDGLDIVICDDASGDDTPALAARYAERFPFIRVFHNDGNVGMDRNFARAVQHAAGTYVWFAGQDDIFEAGAFRKFLGVVQLHPDVDIVYFNYRFLSGDLSREVDPPRLQIREDVFVTSAKEYFSVLDHAPTFLAATVMRRTFWDSTAYERFFDTHYVQMGMVLQNLVSAHVYLVADPAYISCRIPEESWKRKGGQMLFETTSGTLEVYNTVFHSDQNPIPPELFQRKVRTFLDLLPWYTVTMAGLGFRRTPVIDRRMKRLFGRRPVLYWGYVWPLMHLPRWFTALVRRMYQSRLVRWMPRAVARTLRWLGIRGYT